MSSSSASSWRRKLERGATAVEYALGLSLVVAVVIVGIQTLQDGSRDRFGQDQANISDPGEISGPPPTNPPFSIPPPSVTSTSTTIVYRVAKSCGSGVNSDRCTFSLTPTAPASWSVTPTSYSGTPPGPLTFAADGTYTATATVEGQTYTGSVSCVTGGNPVRRTCS